MPILWQRKATKLLETERGEGDMKIINTACDPIHGHGLEMQTTD